MSIKIKTGHARIKMPDGTYQDLSGFSPGAVDVPEKEWELVGTIDTGNKDSGVNVDLSGCTELVVTGYTVSTASTTMSGIAGGQRYTLIAGISANGERSFFTAFEDNQFGVFGDGRYSNTAAATAYNYTMSCYMIIGVSVAEFTKIYFSVPAAITDCNVKIYAR